MSKISETILTLPIVQSVVDLDTGRGVFSPSCSSGPSLEIFESVSVDVVLGVLRGLNSKSNCLDFIPTFLLKECAAFFAPTIAHMCNLSFGLGVFPSEYKIGCITPILKKVGLDPCEYSNYRPVTGLNTFSKIIEKVALVQLRPAIVGSNRFASKQSAYRTAHSTETALLGFTSDVRMNMGRGNATSLLSLDISAAFDTLNHEILLERAESIFGIRGLALRWLNSYLSGRSTFTKLANVSSPTLSVPFGVPQGSTLGPVLFAMYVSPLGELITSTGASYHQYADDTQLYIELTPDKKGSHTLTKCADYVNFWFLKNGLMLNTSKTECMVFATGARQRHMDPDTLVTCVPFTGSTAPVVKSLHILGVTLDSELNFNKHVSETVVKCNAHIRALRHIRPHLTERVAVSLSCAIVQTRLDYCNSLLFETSDQNLDKLQRIQNNLARVVFRTHRRASAEPLLKKLHWLPISKRIKYKLAILTHSAINISQPSYLTDLISVAKKPRVTRLNTRSSQLQTEASCPTHESKLLTRPVWKLAAERPSFCYSAPAVWNSLSPDLRSVLSLDAFRTRLKTELFASSSLS